MSSLFALHIFLFGGELFFASTLVVAAAWLLARGESASQRHLVWFASFGMLAALPFLATFAPAFIHFGIPAPALSQALPVAHDFATVASAPPPAEPREFPIDPAAIAVILTMFWLAGICIMALRGVGAAIALHILRRTSVAHGFNDVPAIASDCELRISTAEAECGPVTWGIFRPIILLPGNAVLWTRERLEAVLLHEAAHIRRHDGFAQALTQFVCALYWPNPLVWLGARAMRREAEMAADDAVINSGVRPSAYAGELLELATEFRANRLSSAMSLFMAAPSGLEARVKAVLAPTQQRSGVNSMDVMKIVCAGVMATTALIVARPSLAQDAPPAPPPVVAEQPLPPAAPAAPTNVATPPDAPMPAEAALPPPAAPPAPAAPAAPAAHDAPVIVSNDDGDANVQIRQDDRVIDGKDVRRIRMIVTHARQQARDAMAKARPEMERAMAEIHAKQGEMRRVMVETRTNEAEMQRVIENERPQIDAALAKIQPELDKAMLQVREDLAKAHLDVKVRERVDQALKHIEIKIQARDAHKDKSGDDQDDSPDNSSDQ